MDVILKKQRPLEDYLRQKIGATVAAQANTRPTVTAESPREVRSCLYIFLLEALVELQSEHIEPLLVLLQAIENLPEPGFTAIKRIDLPYNKLWKGLPHFTTLWSDISYRSGSWKMDAEATSSLERDALRDEHVRRAEIEARLVMASLAGIPIGCGYEVVADALESDETVMDFEVPAAAQWFVICGQRFRQSVEMSEESYALKDKVMSLKQWLSWEERLKELQAQSGVVQRAATRALKAK